MEIEAIILSDHDNVATVLAELSAGSKINVRKGEEIIPFTLNENVPYGHKIALKLIEPGEKIIKYGETIGRATAAINPGCVTHVHNVESLRGRGDLD